MVKRTVLFYWSVLIKWQDLNWRCWETAYSRSEGYDIYWVSHTFTVSYHMVFFLKGRKNYLGWEDKKYLWPMLNCSQIGYSRKMNFCKVRVISLPTHHFLMSLVFSFKAVWDQASFWQRLQTMTARLMFLCKGMDASSREAESAGTSLPRFAKVWEGKTCTTHSNLLCHAKSWRDTELLGAWGMTHYTYLGRKNTFCLHV